jgi:predicted MFS family arabinose efflux permease
MILTNALWSLGGGGVFVLVALLCWQRFPGDAVALGLFFAMTGAGALLAAIVRPWLGRNQDTEIRIIGLSCIVEGGLFLLVPHALSLPLTLLLFCLQLCAAFLFGLVYQPMLLRLSAPSMRGRVSGLDNGIYLSLYGIAAVVYGMLAEHLGLSITAALAGGVMCLAGCLWFFAAPVRKALHREIV